MRLLLFTTTSRVEKTTPLYLVQETHLSIKFTALRNVTGLCPKNWIYSPISKSCIMLGDTTATWQDAKHTCEGFGTRLLEIKQAELFRWIFIFGGLDVPLGGKVFISLFD